MPSKPGTSRLMRALSPLIVSMKLRVGITIFTFLIVAAIFEPVINSYLIGEKSGPASFPSLLPMSIQHPLGTDIFGRDLLALILSGLKNSLAVGFLAGSISVLIGMSMALIAGYKGGLSDQLLTSMTDAMLVLPTYPIFVVLVVYTHRVDLFGMSLILAVFSWPWSMRTIRSQILSLKERPFIELAKISGLNDFEIMFREILPNFLAYLGVAFSYSIMGSLLAETGLRLIGLGPPEIMTLGLIIQMYIAFGVLSMGRSNLLLFPILVLVLLFVSLNLVNMGLDEMFNPRLKKITGL